MREIYTKKYAEWIVNHYNNRIVFDDQMSAQFH